jgi:uncharacterized damage-inducible protein DinB
MTTTELTPEEYHSYYKNYIDMVPKTQTLLAGFNEGKKTMLDFYKAIPEEKLTYRYQPEKWTIKEVFQHIIDTERIFMYRCLRIARNDSTKLSGFEQDDYVVPSEANEKSIEDLLFEYETNRTNSIVLLKGLSEKNLSFIGNASGNSLSARACAFIIIGHEIWHTKVIQERYL